MIDIPFHINSRMRSRVQEEVPAEEAETEGEAIKNQE
jgi:hypothetical protein